MIDLAAPRIEAGCPACAGPLAAEGWYMPGMRTLARARCTACGKLWFADLPVGQGIHTPMLLDPETGAVHDAAGAGWFADWLRDSYKARRPDMAGLEVRRHRAAGAAPVLLNCIDTLYGHSLLKLLNAQLYLDKGLDLILLVQPCLLPLIPDGVAETWLVDLPLKEGTRWSDSLAAAIAAEARRFPALTLAPAHSHPHPSDIAIERFSKTAPFPLDAWASRPPKITFIWRDDRRWAPGLRGQSGAVAALFEALRRRLPGLEAAVAGLATPGGLPGWIADRRTPSPGPEEERAWLQLYADSHAVVGVHGSNMLLPSAHAGAAFDLMPEDRRGNFLQDILFNGSDPRDLFFRYRFPPLTTAPERLAEEIAFTVARYPDFDRLMRPPAIHDDDVRD